MPSLTVENYIKTIYQICTDSGGAPAATGKIAESLGVSPGTVTSMLKTLSDGQLATYMPYEGVCLTLPGRALALRMLRRHRLIELFLVQTLGMHWDEVHEEAENMEHAVSDHVIDRIEEYLGHPQVDPHGDPIPKADGSVETPTGQSLASCQGGESFCLTRVLDQSSHFLRYLSETGLSLGAKGCVLSNRDEAGVVTVEVGGVETTLGREAAAKIIVSEVE
jgi:DtxR family Mn-dependent transcriptional regulator